MLEFFKAFFQWLREEPEPAVNPLVAEKDLGRAAAERLVTNDYHGDGGNIIDANRQRRADEKLVAEAYLRLISQK